MTALGPPVSVAILLPEVPSAAILPHQVAEKVAAQLLVRTGRRCLVGPVYAAVVLQCPEGEVVDVDPYGPTPVGCIVLSVVPASKIRQAAADSSATLVKQPGQRMLHFVSSCTACVRTDTWQRPAMQMLFKYIVICRLAAILGQTEANQLQHPEALAVL